MTDPQDDNAPAEALSDEDLDDVTGGNGGNGGNGGAGGGWPVGGDTDIG